LDFFWFFSDLVFQRKEFMTEIFFFEDIFHKMAKMRHPKKQITGCDSLGVLSTMKSASFFLNKDSNLTPIWRNRSCDMENRTPARKQRKEIK
jgi:hypothetical protein